MGGCRRWTLLLAPLAAGTSLSLLGGVGQTWMGRAGSTRGHKPNVAAPGQDMGTTRLVASRCRSPRAWTTVLALVVIAGRFSIRRLRQAGRSRARSHAGQAAVNVEIIRCHALDGEPLPEGGPYPSTRQRAGEFRVPALAAFAAGLTSILAPSLERNGAHLITESRNPGYFSGISPASVDLKPQASK